MGRTYFKAVFSLLAISTLLIYFSIDVIALSKSLVNIGEVFVSEDSLIFTVIDDTKVSVIGHSDKENLKNLVIPSTVEYMGFEYDVTMIAANAFEDAPLLESVHISYSVEVISTLAFANAPSLKFIYLPQSITTIEDAAFSSCPAIEQVQVANVISPLEYYLAFDVNVWQTAEFVINTASMQILQSDESQADKSAMQIIVVNDEFDNNVYINGVSYRLNHETFEAVITTNVISDIAEELVLPTQIRFNENDYAVVAIGDNAFSSMMKLESIIIPQSIRSIGVGAFSGSSRISDVIINSDNCTIAPHAFENIGVDTQGIKVYFSISNALFLNSFAGDVTNWDSERYVIESDAVVGEEIEHNGLIYEITDINPYEVELIGASDKEIKKLLIEDTIVYKSDIYSVRTIKEQAFFESEIITLFIPNTVDRINTNAFSNSASLKYVYIAAESINLSIATQAFTQVGSASEGVFFFGASAHQYNNLNTTKENWDSEYYFYNFIPPVGGEEFDLGRYTYKIISLSDKGGNVEVLGFAPGYSANMADFPSIINHKLLDFTVIAIGDMAFYDNDIINNIVLGENIATIGESAFAECDNLIDITINYPYRGFIVGANAFNNLGDGDNVVVYGALEEKYTTLSEHMGNWDEEKYRYSPILTTMKATDEENALSIGVKFPGSYDVKSMELNKMEQVDIDLYMSNIITTEETSHRLADQYIAEYAYYVNLSGFNVDEVAKNICPIEIFVEVSGVDFNDLYLLYIYTDEDGEEQFVLLDDEFDNDDMLSAGVKFEESMTVLLLRSNDEDIEASDALITTDEQRNLVIYILIGVGALLIIATVVFIRLKIKKK